MIPYIPQIDCWKHPVVLILIPPRQVAQVSTDYRIIATEKAKDKELRIHPPFFACNPDQPQVMGLNTSACRSSILLEMSQRNLLKNC